MLVVMEAVRCVRMIGAARRRGVGSMVMLVLRWRRRRRRCATVLVDEMMVEGVRWMGEQHGHDACLSGTGWEEGVVGIEAGWEKCSGKHKELVVGGRRHGFGRWVVSGWMGYRMLLGETGWRRGAAIGRCVWMVGAAGLGVGRRRRRRHGGRVAESFVFGQRGAGAECLAALGALDLHATIGVHSFVAAQIRELRVRLGADFALERFERRMDVRVLLEAGRRGECFAALGTGVTASAHVVLANVALEIRGVRENLERKTKIDHEYQVLLKCTFKYLIFKTD